MSLADAAAVWEAKYRAQVIHETFGHLEPKPRVLYKCHIVFAWAGYGGDIVIIDADFKNLDDSPGLYMDMREFVNKWLERRDWKDRGKVLRFDGTYMRFKNAKCRFSGKVRRVKT